MSSSAPRYLQYRSKMTHTVPQESSLRSDNMKEVDPVFVPSGAPPTGDEKAPSSRFQNYRTTLKQRAVPAAEDNTPTPLPSNDTDNTTVDDDLLQTSSGSTTTEAASPASGAGPAGGDDQVAEVHGQANEDEPSGTNTELKARSAENDEEQKPLNLEASSDSNANNSDHIDEGEDVGSESARISHGDRNKHENGYLTGSMQRYLANKSQGGDDVEEDGVVRMELTVKPSQRRSPSPRFQRYRDSLRRPSLRSDDGSSISSSSRTDEEVERSAKELQGSSLLGSVDPEAESTDDENDATAAAKMSSGGAESSAGPSSRLQNYRNTLKQRLTPENNNGAARSQPEDSTADPSSGSVVGPQDRYQKYRTLLANKATNPTGESRIWIDDARVSGSDRFATDPENPSEAKDDESSDSWVLQTPSSSVCGSPPRYQKDRSLLTEDEPDSPGRVLSGESAVDELTSTNQSNPSVTEKLLQMTATPEVSMETSDSSAAASPPRRDEEDVNKTAPSLLADESTGPDAPPMPDAPLRPADRAATAATSATTPRYLAYRSTLAHSVASSTTNGMDLLPAVSGPHKAVSSESSSESSPGTNDAEVPSSFVNPHPSGVEQEDEEGSIQMGTETKNEGGIALEDKENDQIFGMDDGVGLQDDGGDARPKENTGNEPDTEEAGTGLGSFLEKAEKERSPVATHEVDMHTSWSEFDPADMPDTASRVSTASRRGQKRDVAEAQQKVIQYALKSAGQSSKKEERKEAIRNDIKADRLRTHDEQAQILDRRSESESQQDIETGVVSETCTLENVNPKTWQKTFLGFTMICGVVLIILAFVLGLK